MDFLVVSESKLKIMLTREDMKKYGIDSVDVDYDDPKTRRRFWKILDDAKEKCGFDVAGDKVLIQFYPAKEGSEIFVTKLGVLPVGAERAISKSSKVAMLSTRRCIYKFESLDAMICAAKIIGDGSSDRRPRAFIGDNGAYYIVADERGGASERGCDFSYITEYGKEIPSNVGAYIAEHAKEVDFFEILKL